MSPILESSANLLNLGKTGTIMPGRHLFMAFFDRASLTAVKAVSLCPEPPWSLVRNYTNNLSIGALSNGFKGSPINIGCWLSL